ncbi:MAG TPA: hypothetical protein VFI02_03720 [Armatimonadota bacterium]|nr:hypothetical protein [Armatimonadota bacterium]
MREPAKAAKIRRQNVVIHLSSGAIHEHQVCDVALPTPDGKFFLVRDLTAGESRDLAKDLFYNIDIITRVEITSKRYDLMTNGDRREEALDTEPVPGVLITSEMDPEKKEK